jgi:subtilisin family serine protease
MDSARGPRTMTSGDRPTRGCPAFREGPVSGRGEGGSSQCVDYGDILYGGWGTLGALTANGEICQDPSLASFLTLACFKVTGAAFGWLQGTSMSSPNATGVAALTLAAHPALQGNPDGLLTRLRGTVRTDMGNLTGPNDPANKTPSTTAGPCTTGWCHLDFDSPIAFSDAYGAGMVNAGAAVR